MRRCFKTGSFESQSFCMYSKVEFFEANFFESFGKVLEIDRNYQNCRDSKIN